MTATGNHSHAQRTSKEKRKKEKTNLTLHLNCSRRRKKELKIGALQLKSVVEGIWNKFSAHAKKKKRCRTKERSNGERWYYACPCCLILLSCFLFALFLFEIIYCEITETYTLVN